MGVGLGLRGLEAKFSCVPCQCLYFVKYGCCLKYLVDYVMTSFLGEIVTEVDRFILSGDKSRDVSGSKSRGCVMIK